MEEFSPKLWTRWYETDRNVLALVTSLRRMPEWLQEAYSRSIITYTSQLGVTQSDQTFRVQHGGEKHLGLLKSMGRKRWYDKNKYTYRAFNALYLLPPTARVEVSTNVNEGGNVLKRYQECCKAKGVKATGEVVELLLTSYLLQGEAQAFHQLDQLDRLGQLASHSPVLA